MNFFEIKNEQGCFLEGDVLVSPTGEVWKYSNWHFNNGLDKWFLKTPPDADVV